MEDDVEIFTVLDEMFTELFELPCPDLVSLEQSILTRLHVGPENWNVLQEPSLSDEDDELSAAVLAPATGAERSASR
jgi:hypothetical protein